MEQPEQPDKIDPRLIRLAKETANLPSKRDLAWKFLRQGMSPEWCSIQFGFPVDDMRRAQDEYKRREAAKRDK